MIRLLVVEDSALMRKLMSRIFTAEGDFEIATARNGREALAMIAGFNPDVVTLDVHMPEMDGLACLDRIMLEHPCPVVMLSSLTEAGAEETLTALDLGAVDFLAKPDGAISLEIDTLAPRIIEKVRMAARVRLRRSHRLSERLRIGQTVDEPASVPACLRSSLPASGTPGLVLIGTSTGGPPALDVVLSQLPADFPWPVVVAQHMPATFTGPLARRLDKLCPLRVVEVTEPMQLVAGTIYIARGDADMLVSTRAGVQIVLPSPMDREHLWHPSVERLVSSALKRLPASSLVGVLMTGMGSDGSSAMTELKGAGGYTIAEAEETAVVWGMPGELVRKGGAREVLPLPMIGPRLLELIR